MYAEDLHIQPMAGQRPQKLIVGRAGLDQIVRWLIRQQELIVRDVRVVEQVAVEIISTGGGIVGGKAEFFLEVIKRCLTKADRTAAVAVHQRGEHADRRFAGRQSDVALRLEQQLGNHKVGCRAAHLVVGVVNTDVHGHVPLSRSMTLSLRAL